MYPVQTGTLPTQQQRIELPHVLTWEIRNSVGLYSVCRMRTWQIRQRPWENRALYRLQCGNVPAFRFGHQVPRLPRRNLSTQVTVRGLHRVFPGPIYRQPGLPYQL